MQIKNFTRPVWNSGPNVSRIMRLAISPSVNGAPETTCPFTLTIIWKYKLKEEYVSSMLPDIVQIPSGSSVPALPEDLSSDSVTLSCESGESSNTSSHAVSISVGDLSIQAGSTVSDEMLMNLIKAVRYA